MEGNTKVREVYITGHRNPDLDSICSAYGYAVLKNQIDKTSHYTPVRCGHMSEQVKKQMESLDIQIPSYMKDVKAKVGDVMMRVQDTIEATDPVYKLVKMYKASTPSALPVFDKGKFYGLLSIDNITSWFLEDNADDNPKYDFLVRNIESVLPGKVLKRGPESFSASVLAGAAAYEEFTKFVTKDCPSVIVMGYRKRFIEHAIAMNVPAIIISTTTDVPEIDFSSYKGTVYVTELGTAEAMRRLRMTQPICTLMQESSVSLQVGDFFEDGKELLSSSRLRGLPVFDGEEFAGFVTRRCFLNKPTYNVILVDHNEVGQSIRGIEEASVVEIIDHHRLDALKTSLPIFIDAEPLGSTCTIVYQQFQRHNLIPDEKTAKVLLTGIISDTLILKSPTTTVVDKQTAGALAALCGEYDIHAYGERLFSVTQSLSNRDPKAAITADFKTYNENGLKIGIGQCEVTTLKDVDDYADLYQTTLEDVRATSGLDWALLMITDVLRDTSVLIVTDSRFNRKLPWSPLSKYVLDLPGVMSRKKQLLPEVVHAIE